MKQGTIVLVATSQTAAKIPALVKGAANAVCCSHHHSYMSINKPGIVTGLLPPQIDAVSCQTTLSCQGNISRTTNTSQFYTDLKSSLTLSRRKSHKFKAKLLFTSRVSYKCKTRNKLANVYVYCCSLRGWIRRAEQGGSGSALLTQSTWNTIPLPQEIVVLSEVFSSSNPLVHPKFAGEGFQKCRWGKIPLL